MAKTWKSVPEFRRKFVRYVFDRQSKNDPVGRRLVQFTLTIPEGETAPGGDEGIGTALGDPIYVMLHENEFVYFDEAHVMHPARRTADGWEFLS